ncbi:MAG: hypothetical protein ABJC36_14125, partial [Gemmatimonadales bacterium]
GDVRTESIHEQEQATVRRHAHQANRVGWVRGKRSGDIHCSPALTPARRSEATARVARLFKPTS